MNRRNFIRKILGAGAALYVPEKTYGFLFPDKCESWWREKYFAMRLTHDSGLWITALPGVPDLEMSTGIKGQSGWMQVDPAEVDPVSLTVYP